MFATIYFRIRPPGFFGVAARLLDHIRGVEPALQMSATELALGVFFVTGSLSRLLEFYFVMRKLRRGGCYGFGRGQRNSPRCCGKCAAGCTVFILLEGVSAGLPDLIAAVRDDHRGRLSFSAPTALTAPRSRCVHR